MLDSQDLMVIRVMLGGAWVLGTLIALSMFLGDVEYKNEIPKALGKVAIWPLIVASLPFKALRDWYTSLKDSDEPKQFDTNKDVGTNFTGPQ